MITVLVSGASGVVGYGILKSLRNSGLNYRLIGTTIYDDSVAPAFCDVFELAPKTSDALYTDWLLGVIEKHKIDVIIPGIEADMIRWNQDRSTLEKSGVKLLLNNPGLIDLCTDKWKFYEALHAAHPVLAIESRLEESFEELSHAFGLPFLLKPRRGFASKGIVRVDSEKVFDEHKKELGETLMAQPIVGSNEEEYTVSAFFDQDSYLCCYMGLKRQLSTEGFTEKASVASPAGIEPAIRSLAELLKPVGPTNFQFRVHEGQLKLLEINPRVSSATSIRMAFGYNESVMGVEYLVNGTKPDQPKIRNGYAVRYIEEKVFYDSDNI